MWGAHGALIIGGLCLLALLVSVVMGAPVVAIPVALIAVAVIGLVDFRRRRNQTRQMGEFREQAQTEKVDFTARDKETLVSE